MRHEEDGWQPLSAIQHSLWFDHRTRPGLNALRNISFCVRVRGALDRARLEAALELQAARHPILRTRFREIDGTPSQGVDQNARIEVSFVDERLSEEELDQRLHEETVREFDITVAPLMRAGIYRLAVDDFILILVYDHLILDGWSYWKLIDELGSVLEAERIAPASSVEVVEPEYFAYVREQQKFLESAAGERQLKYWTGLLGEHKGELELPTDRPRGRGVITEVSNSRIVVSQRLTEALREVAKNRGVPMFSLLVSAYVAMLHRVARQEVITVASPMPARGNGRWADTIGIFINMVALRGTITPQTTLLDLIRQLQSSAFRALRNQDYPLAELVRRINPPRSENRPPFFQAAFVAHNARDASPLIPLLLGKVGVEPVPVSWGGLEATSWRDPPDIDVEFDLTLKLVETEEHVFAGLYYAPSLFDDETIDRWSGYWVRLLEAIVTNDSQTVDRVDILAADERRLLIETWNATAAAFPEQTPVHELFENQARLSPEALALTDGGRSLCYSELNSMANHLARHLSKRGVLPGGRVAVLLERSIELVVAELAVLKCGAAYVPVDAAFPPERQAFMIRDCGAGAVLVRQGQVLAGGHAAARVDVDVVCAAPGTARNLKVRVGSDAPAYVMYTSGSTGTPKGVIIPHRAIARLVINNAYADFGPTDRIAFAANPAFDATTMEVWAPLLNGGAIVIFDQETVLDPERLGAAIKKQAVNVLFLTTALFNSYASIPRFFSSLRILLTGGDRADPNAFRNVLASAPPRHVVHAYGPTEAATYAISHEVSAVEFGARSISLGRPISNTQAYILDGEGAPVPIGVAGELHIGGPGVGSGYLNRPDLTSERFVADPFSAVPGARMYRTGDLASWRPDGTIEFLGRNDSQIKLRGFRVELGEIEARLTEHVGVREASVIVREDSPGDKRLVAYLTCDVGLGADELRAHLVGQLPDYMVPAAYVRLETLPKTHNGKVDRNALPAPGASAFAGHQYEPPQSEVEKKLAAVWAELLNTDRIGVNDNFFHRGGHSLLAMKMIERLRREGLEVDMRTLFSAPTLGALAKAVGGTNRIEVPPNLVPPTSQVVTPEMLPLVTLDQSQIDAIAARVRGGAANIQDIYPLVPLQEGVLFHHLMGDEGDAYLLSSLMAFDTRPRVVRFLEALEAVIKRHDILRSAVLWEDLPHAVQVVWRRAPLIVERVELDPTEDGADQLALRFNARNTRLELSHAPLLRGYVAQDLPRNRWLLLLLHHHVVIDHTALEVMAQEVQAHIEGRAGDLPPVVPFRNFVAQALFGVSVAEHEAFFRTMLEDVDEPTAPFGVLEIGGESVELDKAEQRLEPRLAFRLRSRARALGVSVASLVHLAFAVVVGHTSGRSDPVFGTVLFGRSQGGAGADQAIGMLINTLPIRIGIGSEPVADAVRRMQDLVVELLRHEHAPLALAQRCSGVPAPAPLFTALLNFRHSAPEGAMRFGDFEGVEILTGEERTNYPVTLSVDDLGEGFELNCQTVAQIGAERLCRLMTVALEGIADALEQAPGTAVSEIGILDEDERRQVIEAWNATTVPYPQSAAIHQLFEAEVARQPMAPAVICGREQWSYSELNKQANRLAHHLRRCGLEPGGRAAILLERSLELVVAELAVLKCGAAYVPVDPTFPEERQTFMIRDCAAAVVLVLEGQILPAGCAADRVDVDRVIVGTGWTDNPAVAVNGEAAAYVMYTSGSTGTPKGVIIPHRAIARLVVNNTFTVFTPSDRVAMVANPAFDATTMEVWGALLNGGAIVVIDQDTVLDPDRFAVELREQGISVMFLTSALFNSYAAIPGMFSGLRVLMTGGDRGDPHAFRQVLRASAPGHLVNGYGPTETTTFAITNDVAAVAEGASNIPLGRPISNTQIYILDEHAVPVPAGVVGEIHIGGPGVGHGYLNRPDLTAERFVADPFSEHAGARMYRTGDLGRWLANGTVEFLGRNDFQVKLRGFRIELGEIETRLAELPGVREAAVVAREDVPGDKRLVAYLITEGDVSVDAVRSGLAERLPDYMVPSAYVRLHALPLTPNGKLDRNALPAPAGESFGSSTYEEPAGELEDKLAEIWSELLNVERIGRNDNFFKRGGHSLLAVQLVSRLRQTLNIEVSLSEVFAHPTLADLAATVSEAPVSELPPVTAVSREGALPLSFAQQRLWFLAQFKQASTAYHMSGGLRMRGELNHKAMARTLKRIVTRHEALRTIFVMEDGKPAQRIQPADIDFELVEHDLSGASGAEAKLERLAVREAAAPFDLEHGPLVRGRLVRLAPNDHVLLVTMHHIVSDGWSLAVLNREMSAIYTAYANGKEDPLPPLTVQYADYAVWQRRWLAGDFLKQQAKFWETTLKGAPAVLTLPTDHPRPAEPDYVGAGVKVRLEPQLSRALRELSLEHGATLHMTMLAAYAVLMGRLAGQTEVVIGSPVANRARAEITDLIGFFVNTVALRVDLTGSPSFWDLLGRVRDVSLAAQQNQDLPFEQVVEIVQPPRSLTYTPLFQSVFALQNTPQDDPDLCGLRISTMDLAMEAAKFDLTLMMEERGDDIFGNFNYAVSLFERSTIERWRDYWIRLLEAMVADENQSIDRVDMRGAEERQHVGTGWNATEASYLPNVCMHELFEAQVVRTPHAVAVACEGREISYEELNARANRLAQHLRHHGVRPDDRVAICVSRSVEMVVGVLAVLKAGGAYVPMDPSYPAARLAHMLTDSAPVVMLLDESGRSAIGCDGAGTPAIDITADAAWARESERNPGRGDVKPRHLAYVIYTSGSTGTPRGVMIAHQELSNLVQWHCVSFDLKAGDRSSCVAGFGFDAATWEIWPALSVGATLVLAPPEIGRSPLDLVEWWQAQEVDVSFLPTPIAEMVLSRGVAPARLRILLTGGDRLRQHPPPSARFRLINNYGPTETTVVATSGEVPQQGILHIGRPIANTKIYILDDEGAEVPIGVAGEVYIGGVGVGRGYLNRPDLTAERFVADPFAAEPGERMYRSGDLARWLGDGTIEFLGRNDFQVKLRGFRIELGEIEVRLNEYPGVHDATVLAREDVPGEKRLVAYFTGDAGIGAEELRSHLTGRLPDYMVPAAYVRLESLPLTANGKLDRDALPAPVLAAFAADRYEPPQGPLEEQLAAIWSRLLNVERIGRNDNFFDLGGHSLLAVTLIEELRQRGLKADMRTAFNAPTLARLAAALSEGVSDSVVDLATAAVLPDDIQPLPVPPKVKPDCVLLTGATGFVGRFLLRELLDQRPRRVLCMVRAADERSGFERLQQILKRWSLWRPGDEDRIEVITGDLALPGLGLSERGRLRACEEPDAIFHAATSMNHLESFESAAKANVDGVAEILRLATSGRPKTVHYLSTMGVFSSHGHDGIRMVNERTPITAEMHLGAEGYTTSKWVGEQLVHLAAARGVPCNVYRLGLITGDTELGRYDELQTFHRLLESCIRIGAGFDSFRYDQMITPVDATVRALVRLGDAHAGGGGIFHVAATSVTPIATVFAFYNAIAQKPLAILPYREWLGRVKARFVAGETLPIIPLVHPLLDLDEPTLRAFIAAQERATVRFDCSRTAHELEQAGVVWPVFNMHLMRSYLQGMLAANPALNTHLKIADGGRNEPREMPREETSDEPKNGPGDERMTTSRTRLPSLGEMLGHLEEPQTAKVVLTPPPSAAPARRPEAVLRPAAAAAAHAPLPGPQFAPRRETQPFGERRETQPSGDKRREPAYAEAGESVYAAGGDPGQGSPFMGLRLSRRSQDGGQPPPHYGDSGSREPPLPQGRSAGLESTTSMWEEPAAPAHDTSRGAQKPDGASVQARGRPQPGAHGPQDRPGNQSQERFQGRTQNGPLRGQPSATDREAGLSGTRNSSHPLPRPAPAVHPMPRVVDSSEVSAKARAAASELSALGPTAQDGAAGMVASRSRSESAPTPQASPVADTRRDRDPAPRHRPAEREPSRRPAAHPAKPEEPVEPRSSRGMSFGSKLAILAAVFAVGLGTAWYLLAGTWIKGVTVVRGEAVQIVYATGPVESETWARLTPLVRGRIVERCRCEGAAVKMGQRLARLDDREGQAVLKDLRAQESYLTMEFERQSQLMEKGATTAQAYQKTQIELDRIHAQVAAQIERLRYYELSAPMDGVVLKEDGEVGDMVDPGTILYQVGLPRPLWVVGEVNEEDVPRVTPGQKALLRSDAFPGKILDGYVKQITPAGDPVAKTFRVRIGLPEDTPLHIGMTAEINIITGKKSDVLLVPATSVFNNTNVLVVTDHIPVVRKVEIGIRGTSNFEVISGLKEGEVVATDPNPEIRNLKRVIVTIEKPGQ
ncbi:MAG: amino acid adenylation domain-containing protein [Alphaproteobacteria bacterium]|nr:amino acid adenylation domain-containing protein [Alphaproteobacteria bacterium]